jgi:hypothetical protein
VKLLFHWNFTLDIIEGLQDLLGVGSQSTCTQFDMAQVGQGKTQSNTNKSQGNTMI